MLRSLSRALALLLFLSACESKGADRAIAYDASDLPCASGDATHWESAPLPDLSGGVSEECVWVRFPGRTVVEIAHALGFTPVDVAVYTSFSDRGESSTVASGDSGRIVGADDSRVLVENTTEQDFYLRVTLR